EEVANRVGISRAAIYLHFPGKEDLVYALLEYGMKSSAERLDMVLAQAISPPEKVRAIIERSCDGMTQPLHQVFSMLVQSPTFLNNVAYKRERMRELWRPTMQRLAAVLDEGKRTGDFDPEMPTSLMVTLLRGLLTPWIYKNLVEQDGIPLPLVVNRLSRYFLKGVAPDRPGDTPVVLPHEPASDQDETQTTLLTNKM
ncbi:MAG TPA: TetR/AcrR family transcriptional regulator, partial [Ktedonobacterales bacterium]|nr:TetR/AcrR family transcriptional regulator [Ktedonobacterales bacterium]